MGSTELVVTGRIFLIDRKLAALVRGNEDLRGSSIGLVDQEGQVPHGRQFTQATLQQGSLQENVDAGVPQEPGE